MRLLGPKTVLRKHGKHVAKNAVGSKRKTLRLMFVVGKNELCGISCGKNSKFMATAGGSWGY